MNDVWRFVGAALLFLHGLIHLLGPLAALGLVDGKGLGGVPGGFVAVLWTAVAVLLIGAGLVLLRRNETWRWLAIGGAVLSQALVFSQWPEAAAGTVANVIIVLMAIVSTRLGIRFGVADDV